MQEPQPVHYDSSRPPVLVWYRVYAAAMALLYLLCVLGGAAFLVFRDQLADRETPPEAVIIYGVILAGMGLVFAIAYLAAFFLPRARWAWIYHLVMICIGLTSCCTIPASVPLLIFWLKPETQDYFGR
jgi:hypothetical protein